LKDQKKKWKKAKVETKVVKQEVKIDKEKSEEFWSKNKPEEKSTDVDRPGYNVVKTDEKKRVLEKSKKRGESCC